MRVFFAPGGWTAFGPNADGLVNLLVALALVYILIKIPFWVLHQVRAGGGRSSVGSLARGFIAYKGPQGPGLFGGILLATTNGTFTVECGGGDRRPGERDGRARLRRPPRQSPQPGNRGQKEVRAAVRVPVLP